MKQSSDEAYNKLVAEGYKSTRLAKCKSTQTEVNKMARGRPKGSKNKVNKKLRNEIAERLVEHTKQKRVAAQADNQPQTKLQAARTRAIAAQYNYRMLRLREQAKASRVKYQHSLAQIKELKAKRAA